MTRIVLEINNNNTTTSELDLKVDSSFTSCLHDDITLVGKNFPDKQLLCYCLSKIMEKLKVVKNDRSKKLTLSSITICGDFEIDIPQAESIIRLFKQENFLNTTRISLQRVSLNLFAINALHKLEYSKRDHATVQFYRCKLDIGQQQPKGIVFEYSQHSNLAFEITTRTCCNHNNDTMIDMQIAQEILKKINRLALKISTNSTKKWIQQLEFCEANMSIEAVEWFFNQNNNVKALKFDKCKLFFDNIKKDANNNNNNDTATNISLLAGSFCFHIINETHLKRVRCCIQWSGVLNKQVAKVFTKIFDQMEIDSLKFKACSIDVAVLRHVLQSLLFVKGGGSKKVHFQNCTFFVGSATTATTTSDDDEPILSLLSSFPSIEHLEWDTQVPNLLVLYKNINNNNNVATQESSISTTFKLITGNCFPVGITKLKIFAISMNQSQCQEIIKGQTLTNLQTIIVEVATTESLTDKIRARSRRSELLLETFFRELLSDTINSNDGLSRENNNSLIQKMIKQHQCGDDNKKIISLVQSNVNKWGYDNSCNENLQKCIEFCLGLIRIRHREILDMDLPVSLFPFILEKIRYDPTGIIYWILVKFPQIIIVQKTTTANQTVVVDNTS